MTVDALPWLQEAPAHWRMQRLDHVASLAMRQVEVGRINAQEVFHYSIPMVQATGSGAVEDGGDIASSKLLVDQPMVLIAKLNPRKGTVCLADPQEVLTVCSTEFVPIVPKRIHREFLYYVLSSEPYRTRLEAMVTSVTNSHQRVDPSEIIKVTWGLPPPEEQRRIAAFLDHETARIDELVREKNRLKAALLERRHATTVAAASGRLLSKELQATWVPWLEHHAVNWSPVRIRFVARLGSGHTPSRSNPEYWQDCSIPWITTGEVRQIRDDRVEYLTTTREQVSELGVRNSAAVVHPAGTVVLSRTASAGFSAIMGLDMATSQDFVTWTCGPRLRPRFLLLCLRAMRPDLLGRLAMGSTHKTIYFPDVESLAIPLPPVEEQDEAVERAWSQLAKIDSMTDALDAGIRLLRERRSALITAAVTGQIDVSTWTPPDDWLSTEAA